MSLARFDADGSDVYVFDDVEGGITCCACRLGRSHEYNSDEAGMIAHLLEHREAGHTVPESTLDRLRARFDAWGKAPARATAGALAAPPGRRRCIAV